MPTTKSGTLDAIFQAHQELLGEARRNPPPAGSIISEPPIHPAKDLALDSAVRTKLVRLANAYKRGGRAAMKKIYDELYPEKKRR